MSFSIGSLLINYQNHKNHFLYHNGSKHNIVFNVSENLKSSEYYHRYYIEPTQIDGVKIAGYRLLMEQQKENGSLLAEGITYQSNLILQDLPKPISPYHFNYREYLQKHHIYLKSRAYEEVLYIQDTPGFIAKIQRFRNKLMSDIANLKLHQSTKDILYGFILGVKTEISENTYQSFVKTGVIHLLSISGMHVGVVFLFLTLVFKFLKKQKTFGIYLYISVVLLSIWIYALFSGFSVPVIRASVMITFYILGDLKKSPRLSFESIVSSMLLLLMIDPYYLFDVGFQLSYIAIISLAVLFPFFKKLIKTKNRGVQYVLDILLMSFIAQLGVLPLTLYYFHQFPLSFLFANLFAILLLPVVFYGGIVVIFLLLIGNVTLIHWYDTLCVYYLKGIDMIANLNWMVSNLYLSELQMWIGYGIIFSILITLYHRKIIGIVLLGVFVLLIVFKPKDNQSRLMFLNIKTLCVVKSQQEFCTVFTQMPQSEELLKPIVCQQKTQKMIYSKSKIFHYKGNCYQIIDSNKELSSLKKHNSILVIDGSPKVNFERLLSKTKPLKIIFTKNNYQYLIYKWKETCLKKQVSFEDIRKTGCLII